MRCRLRVIACGALLTFAPCAPAHAQELYWADSHRRLLDAEPVDQEIINPNTGVAQGEGAVAGVVLSLGPAASMLPHDGSEELLVLTLHKQVPSDGCEPCTVEFQDGMRGSGQALRNMIVSEGMSITPVTTGCTVNVCAAPRVITTKVVDTDMRVPDTEFNFFEFSGVSLGPTGVVFQAINGDGLYRAFYGPPFDVLVDTNTTIPDTDVSLNWSMETPTTVGSRPFSAGVGSRRESTPLTLQCKTQLPSPCSRTTTPFRGSGSWTIWVYRLRIACRTTKVCRDRCSCPSVWRC